MIFFILAQIIGIVGLFFAIIASHYRKKSNILISNLVASACYGIQYLLLGAYSGLASKIIAVARNTLIITKDKQRKKETWLLYVFVGVYIVMAFITFEKWYSIFAIAAGLVYTIVVWNEKNAQTVRKVGCFCSVLWLIYNVCVLSIPGIIRDSADIISSLIAIFRYRTKKITRRKR